MTNGSIVNTGTATGTPPTGPTVTDQSQVTVPYAAASITIAKSASIASYSASNVPVTYHYLVTNTGNVTLNPVTVTDPMANLSAISCPDTQLAAGDNETCSATYTTTSTDVTNGSIVNTGTATGTPPTGPTVTDQSQVTVPYAAASITIAKSASIASYSASNVPVTYHYLVTNTGNVTLNPVTVTDPMANLSAISCPDTQLAAGDNETCSATYTTTSTDVTNGSIVNTGTATGTPPTGPTVTDQSQVTVPYAAASITIAKSASIASYSASNVPVTYHYLVTNTGNVTLNPVTVTDPMANLSAISCPDTQLAAGDNETCSATYTTTSTDVTNGSIVNTGTATGTPPTGPTVTDQSQVTVPYAAASITIAKSASIASYSASNVPVTYHYLVTNTGNVTLNPVTVTDPMANLSAISCPDTQLAAGDNETCSATYTTTSTDVTNGSIVNTGTATGTPPTGPTVTDQSQVTVPYAAASITIAKSASIASYSASNVPVTYHYLVTNTGNVTLNPVTVTDPMANLSAISCPDTQLAAGDNETCSATYTTTSADVTNGSIVNTGTATGTPPTGPTVTDQSQVTVPYAAASITIAKSASIASYSASDVPVTYHYLVTNTGNVTLNPVTVTDPMANLSAISCPDTQLAAGDNETCSATYTTTAADVTNGSIVNTGTATGTPPTGPTVTDQSQVTVPYAAASITIAKSASIASYSASDVPVTYHYLVTNTGNVTLNPVTVTDPMAGLSAISCPDTQLAAGDNETCSATYTTTAADVTNGSIVNTGTATGTPPTGPTVTDQSQVTVPYAAASITIAKSASIASYSASNVPVTYHYLVTNTGNVTLNPVTVTDPMAGLSAISCPDTQLAAGDNETCSATYTTTAADVTNGSIVNTGTATGTPPTGPTVTDQSQVTVPYAAASITIAKSASIASYSASNVPVTYHYLVTNTGNVTLNPVTVTDPMAGLSAISCPDTQLAAGDNETCSATYTTTSADVTNGSIVNTGTATGTPPTGPTVTDQSQVTVPYAAASITIAKSASIASYSASSVPVTYHYLVTNTGNVTLNPVTVTDPMASLSAISCPDTQLAAGDNETCSATYTTTVDRRDQRLDREHRHRHGHPAHGPDGHRPVPGHRPLRRGVDHDRQVPRSFKPDQLHCSWPNSQLRLPRDEHRRCVAERSLRVGQPHSERELS